MVEMTFPTGCREIFVGAKRASMAILQTLVLFTFILAAAPAHADITDSGNLAIGGTGVIQGTMTVQGAGFSVGGTTFSVAGGSVTLGGRLNAAASGIKWADGTTSTTAAGGSASVYLTTFTTNIPSASGSNTTFSAAVSGSSITLTGTTATKVRCFFNGECDLNTTGAYVFMTMMVDGGFAPGYSSSKAMMASYMGDASGAARNCSFSFLFTGLSAGNHTFALAFRAGAGSWLLEDPTSTWGNQFSCSEVP